MFRAAVLAALAAVSSATNIYVSSYAGNITTLSLTECDGKYSLEKTFYNQGCSPNPSWLTLDSQRGVLYCLDEGLTVPNGSLSSYTINRNGSLNLVHKATTISGPVNGVIYGERYGQRAISLAHYTGSAVSSWLLDSIHPGNFSLNQNIPFTLAHPGPVPARQDAPHEHEAILDPTGQYIVVPDLGADLVRVFSWADGTDKLTAHTPLQAAAGSGPRHAVFYNPYGTVCENCTTYFYLVAELGNTVTGYAVTYPAAGGLAFEEIYKSSTYGNLSLPAGNAAAEIAISPDNRFVVISNRNNTSFSLPNPNPNNATQIPSDSLSTFALSDNGTLSFVQLTNSGGSYPRQFSMNAAGDLVGVGLQYSSLVIIKARDTKTGLIGDTVAQVEVDGQITCVRWDEEWTVGGTSLLSQL